MNPNENLVNSLLQYLQTLTNNLQFIALVAFRRFIALESISVRKAHECPDSTFRETVAMA